MKLLVSQKDQLFDIIEKVGLSPAQFEFKETSGTVVLTSTATVLAVKNTDFYSLLSGKF